MDYSPTQGKSPDSLNIRTETTSDIKTRSRRPCDSCRRRKSRCELIDGKLPCILCRFHRQECAFIEEPPPRKRRAALLDDKESSSSREYTYVKSPTRLEGMISGSTAPISSGTRLDKRGDYAELRGPSLLKKTLGLQNTRHSRLISATSEFEHTFLQLDSDHDRADIHVGTSLLRVVDDHDSVFLLTPDEGTRNYEDEIPDLDAIERIVSPHGQALIHLYFRIVHPSFPILHKNVFLEKYQRSHREFSPPLLAAVYILASNWWSYSSDLALVAKPDISALEKLAFKTINDISYRPKLSTIQAGLLLLQRPDGESWAMTSTLVGLGQDLGLHLDCSTWDIPSWERGLRKRLAWGLFMQDKWGALLHGRPSHITLDDWEVQALRDNDFPENASHDDDEDGSTEIEKGKTIFCEMIRLTEILSVVLSTFYSRRALAEIEGRATEGVRGLLEKAKPIQLALRQWYADLPPTLKMENIAMRKLSSTGYLHLGYYAVEMTLHRRILRSLSFVDDAAVRSICRQAARARLVSAMDFVQALRPEHLQSFWYSASSYSFALVGTFICLLCATSTERQEADLYRKKLEEYRWMLRLSSKSAEFLERAVSMLAASTGIFVKAIPEQPDADMVLRRALRRANSSSVAARVASQHMSPADRSESELHEGASPNTLGDTLSESDAIANIVATAAVLTPADQGDWASDPHWYTNAMDRMDAVGESFQGHHALSEGAATFEQMPAMEDLENAHDI